MAIKLKRGSRKNSIYSVFDEWLENCKNRGLSPVSIITYKEKVMMFLEYVGDIYIEDLDETTVYDFRYWLKEHRNFNAVSQNTTYRSINVFLKFMHEEYLTQDFHIDYVRVDKTIKKIFSYDDIKKLIKQPNLETCGYSELRDWVIVKIILETGVRASSIVNVKIDDIDFKQQTITFRHMKNRQQQIFPLKKDIVKLIQLYLEYVGEELDDYIFINSLHNPLSSKQLSVSFQRYCKNRNVKITSIHCLRHFFATELLKATNNIHLVSKTLGHSSVAITERYIATLGLNEYKATLESIDILKHLK